MSTPIAAFLSEAVALDAFSGRLTAFNILDGVVAPQVPARLGKLVAVVVYELSTDAVGFHERVSLRSPAGETIASTIAQIELAARRPGGLPNTHRSIHVFWNTRLDSYGDYTLLIEQAATPDGRWEEVKRCLLTVAQGLLPGQPEPPLPAPQARE